MYRVDRVQPNKGLEPARGKGHGAGEHGALRIAEHETGRRGPKVGRNSVGRGQSVVRNRLTGPRPGHCTLSGRPEGISIGRSNVSLRGVSPVLESATILTTRAGRKARRKGSVQAGSSIKIGKKLSLVPGGDHFQEAGQVGNQVNLIDDRSLGSLRLSPVVRGNEQRLQSRVQDGGHEDRRRGGSLQNPPASSPFRIRPDPGRAEFTGTRAEGCPGVMTRQRHQGEAVRPSPSKTVASRGPRPFT